MPELAAVKAIVNLTPRHDPALLSAIGEQARAALRGREVKDGELVRLPVSVPLTVEVRTPQAGVVNASTKVEVVTQATATKSKGEDVPLFSETAAPSDRLRAMWDSIIGKDDVKDALVERVATIIREREHLRPLHSELGIHGRFLLAGPPGTGKTSLAVGFADALARRLNATVGVFEFNTSTILSKYVGESARNVASIFEQIRARAGEYDHTVVVIDEYDALAGDRNDDQDHKDAKRAVNELLKQLDQTSLVLNGVMLFAISNVADRTDRAVLRRFDRIHIFDPPAHAERRVILAQKLLRLQDSGVLETNLVRDHLEEAARLTEGYSGADLARVVGEATLLALGNGGKRIIDHAVLMEAVVTVKPASEILKR